MQTRLNANVAYWLVMGSGLLLLIVAGAYFFTGKKPLNKKV